MKVALDRHKISMLKNKIYQYLSSEILKNFMTILLTFTLIAWVVRAVNFLDLMIDDGYSAGIYFKYSILNISTITTRFIPLALLLSLIISILKFERQQELLILWTAGLGKLKVANIFCLIALFVTLFQIILGLFVNPFSLNVSRSLLRESETMQINSMLKLNDFSDAFKGLTFYIDKKNSNNELLNVFIKDTSGSLNTIIAEASDSKNSTIIAEKGYVANNKLFLFEGTIQSFNKKNEIKIINFEKTELTLSNLNTRTIKYPKIQETSSYNLIQCLFEREDSQNLQNCTFGKNKKEIIQAISRRLGMPLYIPLISVIASFLLIDRKEKKYNHLKKYFVFSTIFIILIFAEIFLKYTGFSVKNFVFYFSAPIVLFVILYFFLIKNMMFEKKI